MDTGGAGAQKRSTRARQQFSAIRKSDRSTSTNGSKSPKDSPNANRNKENRTDERFRPTIRSCRNL